MTKPMETIPPGYLTKPEAMKFVNRSIKIFEKLVRQHKIRSIPIKAAGRVPVPAFAQADLEELLKAMALKTSSSLARTTQGPAPRPRLALPQGKQALLLVAPNHKHLLSMKEAQALGWPHDLLVALKKRENPPGIWYGEKRTSFKFSAEALKLELEG